MYGKEGLSEDGMGMGMRMNMYGGQQRRRQREKRHGMSIVVPVFTSLEQLYKGDVIEAAHKKQVICAQWEDCETTCTRCGGSGIVIQTMQIQPGFIQQVRERRPSGGTNKSLKEHEKGRWTQGHGFKAAGEKNWGLVQE